MKNLLHMDLYSRRKGPKNALWLQELAHREGTPLLLVNCQVIEKQYKKLAKALPGTDFFYAIKTLPHQSVINTLYSCGCGFDIASNGEIAMVESCGVPAARCIHTHPIKRPSDIERSLDYGCTTFVVDNPWELEKFIKYRDRASILIRVGFRSPDAVVDLARKYGCQPEDVFMLLEKAAEAGISVKGLSFHVGSQAITPHAHVRAIEDSRDIIRESRRRGLFLLEILDIGGGFPAAYSDDVPEIEEFCAPLRDAISSLPGNTRVIAEPGRYIAAPAVTAISSVIGKAMRGDKMWYYLDDGVYGSYSGRIYDSATYPIEVLKKDGTPRPSVLAGPTCDSIDVIAEDIMLPELEPGDLVIGHMMGAYTIATATDFNLFPRPKIVVMKEKQGSSRAQTHVLQGKGFSVKMARS